MSEITTQDKTIKDLQELKLVGYRVLCSGDQYLVEIPKTALRLSERIGEIKQVVNPFEQIGAFVVENEAADEDGYWVCYEVKEYKDIPAEMVTLTIPAQKYAAMRHIGSNHQIMEAYNDLHRWIDENGYVRQRNKWHIEKFHDWKNPEQLDVELLDTVE